MRFVQSFVTLFTAALGMTGVFANSQANVNESYTTILYVDAQHGSDHNSGTSLLPFKTIQTAVNKADANNQKSIGTKVIIQAGVYRELVNLTAISKQTSVPTTIEAATTGTAIIAGSDILTGWSQEDSANSSIYSHSWPHSFGTCGVPAGWPTNFAPIALRTEMIFTNSIPLTQVMSYGAMRAGTFFVNETYEVIHIWPPSSTNMATAVVEAAVRPATLNVTGRSNIVLRGLVFRHAATCINQSSANVTNSNNVLIDHDQAVWNNWGGLNVNSTTNVTVQNSVASYNGGAGFQGKEDVNVLFNSDESDYNNWRGAQAALYDWGMGGTKLMLMRQTTVEGQKSYRNQAQGLWLDTDNKNIAINNAILSENTMPALQIEANQGPISLTGSTLCSSGSGLTIINTEALTINDNVFYNNGGTNKYQAEIFIAGNPGGRLINDWQTGQTDDLFTEGTTMSGNAFEDASLGQNVFGTYLGGDDWSQFIDTLNSISNRWFDPYTTMSFKVVNGKLVTLYGWQTSTGTDLNSDWERPTLSPVESCAVPAPSFPDYSVNLDNNGYTMASGKAVVMVRVNSFAFGAVKLSVSGVPPGVSAALSGQSLISGAITLTLTASKSAVNQNVPITLWAYGKDRVHSATFYVHVIP